jgi:hypothetical protein
LNLLIIGRGAGNVYASGTGNSEIHFVNGREKGYNFGRDVEFRARIAH